MDNLFNSVDLGTDNPDNFNSLIQNKIQEMCIALPDPDWHPNMPRPVGQPVNIIPSLTTDEAPIIKFNYKTQIYVYWWATKFIDYLDLISDRYITKIPYNSGTKHNYILLLPFGHHEMSARYLKWLTVSCRLKCQIYMSSSDDLNWYGNVGGMMQGTKEQYSGFMEFLQYLTSYFHKTGNADKLENITVRIYYKKLPYLILNIPDAIEKLKTIIDAF